MIFLFCREVHKSDGYQSARRTAAIASLKVGSRLSYHAAARGPTAPRDRTKLFAHHWVPTIYSTTLISPGSIPTATH
jgi:hypothetical protein